MINYYLIISTHSDWRAALQLCAVSTMIPFPSSLSSSFSTFFHYDRDMLSLTINRPDIIMNIQLNFLSSDHNTSKKCSYLHKRDWKTAWTPTQSADKLSISFQFNLRTCKHLPKTISTQIKYLIPVHFKNMQPTFSPGELIEQHNYHVQTHCNSYLSLATYQ